MHSVFQPYAMSSAAAVALGCDQPEQLQVIMSLLL